MIVYYNYFVIISMESLEINNIIGTESYTHQYISMISMF